MEKKFGEEQHREKKREKQQRVLGTEGMEIKAASRFRALGHGRRRGGRIDPAQWALLPKILVHPPDCG